MQKSYTILFCGGGSFGHLVPSLAVAAEAKKIRPDLRAVFVCSDRSEEIRRLQEQKQHFYPLRAPKLPHRLSLGAMAFPPLFIAACLQARKILKQEKPDLIFSKGGFVSVPVCLMARQMGIPIVLHESDSVMSASARLVVRFAKSICTGFPSIGLPEKFSSLTYHTGNPVRTEIFAGSEAAGRRITGFSGRRPVLMIIGGSQGSVALNDAVMHSLSELLESADIIHITGVGKNPGVSHARYFVRETVSEELPHLYALASLVVTRAGAGTLSELGALSKAVIAVPLTGVAHNHQLKNAEFLLSKHALVLLSQEQLSTLPSVVKSLLQNGALREHLGMALRDSFPTDAAKKIATILLADLRASKVLS